MDEDEDPTPTDLARQIAEADGPPNPVEPSDEPNAAIGFLGLLLYPWLRPARRRQRDDR